MKQLMLHQFHQLKLYYFALQKSSTAVTVKGSMYNKTTLFKVPTSILCYVRGRGGGLHRRLRSEKIIHPFNFSSRWFPNLKLYNWLKSNFFFHGKNYILPSVPASYNIFIALQSFFFMQFEHKILF